MRLRGSKLLVRGRGKVPPLQGLRQRRDPVSYARLSCKLVQLLLISVPLIGLFHSFEIGTMYSGGGEGGGTTTSTTIFVTSAISTQFITTVSSTFYSTVTSYVTSASALVTVVSILTSKITSLSTVMSIYTSVATQVVLAVIQQNPLDPYMPIFGAILGAGAAWGIQRWRLKKDRTNERLQNFYTPLHSFAQRGLPVHGEFWRLMDVAERTQLFAILAERTHLALGSMHELIVNEILPLKSAGQDPFAKQPLRLRFQNQVIQDYGQLRRRY